MNTYKVISICLVVFMATGGFAGSVAAGPGCSENLCRPMAARPTHHHSGSTALALDCCSRHRQVPCDLERSRSHELTPFCVSSFRLTRPHFIGVIRAIDNSKTLPAPAGDDSHLAAASVTARSSPIFLKNLTLLC